MLGPKNPESSVCWCLSHRLDSKTNHALAGPARGEYVRKLCNRKVAPGVLAYCDGEVAGWAAVARTDADAPHRPDGQRVDVRDLGRPRERQFRPGRDRGPPGDLAVAIGQDARRDLAAAQIPDVLASRRAEQLTVGLRVQPVAEAPAHRGIGVLGPEHGRNVAEPCLRRGPDHGAHRVTLRQGGAGIHDGQRGQATGRDQDRNPHCCRN